MFFPKPNTDKYLNGNSRSEAISFNILFEGYVEDTLWYSDFRIR